MSSAQGPQKALLPFKVISINRVPKDFIAATRHLSVEDRGAYQEVLDQIVEIGQDEEPPSLPDDLRFMANLMGWPIQKWKATRKRLCEGTGSVLLVVNGRISQARIVEEIDAARDRILRSSEAGKASAAAKKARKADSLRVRMNGNSESTSVDAKLQRPLTPSTTPSTNSEVNSSSTSYEPRTTIPHPTGSEEKKSPTDFSKKRKIRLPEKQYQALAFRISRWITERRDRSVGESEEKFFAAFAKEFSMTYQQWEAIVEEYTT